MHRTQLLRGMTLSYVILPPGSESINTSSTEMPRLVT
jgi:hypothetical protein